MRSIDRSRWNVQLVQRVLATDPISYWVGDEKRGSVAYDLVSGRVAGAQNGAITGVTLGQPGIGDGRTSGQFDGATDFVDVNTPAFAVSFNGSEGTISSWGRTSAWADATARYLIRVRVDADNQLWINKTVNLNQLQFRYEGSNVIKAVNHSISTLDWFQATLTWSFSAGVNGQVIAYVNGEQTGAIQTALGAWVGVPVISVIGAENTVPSGVWDGFINHVPVWDYARSPAEVASLYQESF